MKFLLFELRDGSYYSYTYFAESIAKELSARGHDVEVFNITESNLDEIEKYVGSSYDAVIDFNSKLPRALLDDDSYFLDHIDAPFYYFLLDHPLYHHETLRHQLQNFNVTALDYNHAQYIRDYYPHIRSCQVIPVTGSINFSQKDDIDFSNWDSRPYDILFSGTYTDPDQVEGAISGIPGFMQNLTRECISLLLSEPGLTIEQAALSLAKSEKYDFINADFQLHLHSLYLADSYVRAYNRRKLLQSLDKCQHKLHIYGAQYETLHLNNAIYHTGIPFNLTFSKFAEAKLVVNLMPNFKAGYHDRIFSAQLNGAVAYTDASSALLQEYIDHEDIVFYDLSEPDRISEIADGILNDTDAAIKIAQAGHARAMQNHTWANVCDKFLELLG